MKGFAHHFCCCVLKMTVRTSVKMMQLCELTAIISVTAGGDAQMIRLTKMCGNPL